MLNIFLIIAFFRFMNCCTYYGLTMNAGSLGSNLYLSIILSGIVELPAYVLTLFLIESRYAKLLHLFKQRAPGMFNFGGLCLYDLLLFRLGRRLSIVYVMMLGGFVCAIMLMIPPGKRPFKVQCSLI